jgi:adenylate kinase family enzyme
MINGWILTGFPKNSSQMYYLENNINNTLKPSLIIIVDMDEEFSSKRSGTRRIDPTTGKVYYLEGKTEKELNPHIKERLVIKNEDQKNVLKKRLDNWKKLSIELQSKNIGNHVLRLNGESNFENLIENISDAMENAS